MAKFLRIETEPFSRANRSEVIASRRFAGMMQADDCDTLCMQTHSPPAANILLERPFSLCLDKIPPDGCASLNGPFT
jgi:hypothetical protein